MSISEWRAKLIQHVIEEPDAGLVVIGACAVQIDLDRDLGLGGLAADLGCCAWANSFCYRRAYRRGWSV